MPRLKFRLRTLFLAVGVMAGVLYAVVHFADSLWPTPLHGIFGSYRAIRVVSNPTRIEAFRIAPPLGISPAADVEYEEYRVIDGPILLDDETRKSLSRILTSPKSYTSALKGIKAHCNVRLHVVRENRSIDVDIAFNADRLLAYEDGELLGFADFDNAASELSRILEIALAK